MKTNQSSFIQYTLTLNPSVLVMEIQTKEDIKIFRKYRNKIKKYLLNKVSIIPYENY